MCKMSKRFIIVMMLSLLLVSVFESGILKVKAVIVEAVEIEAVSNEATLEKFELIDRATTMIEPRVESNPQQPTVTSTLECVIQPNQTCSIISLTAGVLTALIAMILLWVKKNKTELKNCREVTKRKEVLFRYLTLVLAVMAILILIMTQNLAYTIVLIDKYSLILIVILLLTALFAVLSMNKNEK